MIILKLIKNNKYNNPRKNKLKIHKLKINKNLWKIKKLMTNLKKNWKRKINKYLTFTKIINKLIKINQNKQKNN